MRTSWARESEYHEFCRFDHSFEELEYDGGIANLEGRELVTAAYHDSPRVYMSIEKTVDGINAESNKDSKSKEISKVSIKN